MDRDGLRTEYSPEYETVETLLNFFSSRRSVNYFPGGRVPGPEDRVSIRNRSRDSRKRHVR